ncbi:DUF292 domain protein [Aspergillus stella-maris]|uniref:DUF292 domain protein n=1 Tax=Aspergillus stella-maris TaxID=1810926 RepID=UPI003CCCDE5E
MPPTPQTAKLTSTLHLLIPRLRLLQKKSTASSVVQRRELAQLLESNRLPSARIRVENVIATDIAIEVMEMVELYCELLLARAGVLDGLVHGEAGTRMRGRVREEMGALNKERGISAGGADLTKTGGGGGFFSSFFGGGKQQSQSQPQPSQASTPSTPDLPSDDPYYLDSALDEASVAIFYAWSRFPTEVRELTLLRSLLADRYGKDFMSLASENKLVGVKVPERLVKGLRVKPPSQELVESYLLEIARAYKVPWSQQDNTTSPDEIDHDEGDDTGAPSGGDIPLPIDSLVSGIENDGEEHDGKRPDQIIRRASETAELNRATPPRGFDKHSSPVSVAPPGARSDNPNPRVRVPGDEKGVPSPGGSPSAQRGGRGGEGGKIGGDKSGIPDLDELSRRFAALKR